MKTRHIIWDWNGTLLNDAPTVCDMLNEMLSSRDLPTITFDHYQRIHCHPVQRIYEAVGFDLIKEPFESVAHKFHAEYEVRAKKIKLHHDSLSALERAKTAGITQTVLSALPHNLLCDNIRTHGLDTYFSYIHGLGDSLGRSKIDNGHILMQKIGIPANNTVLIGDSSHDAETAEALGTKCLLVSRGFEDRQKLLKHGVPVLYDFSEMSEYLEF